MNRKIARFVSICLIIILFITGCTKKDKTSEDQQGAGEETVSLFTPGSYEGIASGFGGDLKVQVTVTDLAIESITILEHHETAGIGTTAVDQVPAMIIENQSLAVDAISGCTYTKDAIVTAVEVAIKDHCSNLESLYIAKDKPEADWQLEDVRTQVLVLGGGGAGISAALAAKAAGADVVIIEKMPFLGGAASISGGQVNAGGSDYQKASGVTGDSAEIMAADLLKGGHDLNDQLLVDLYSKEVGSTFDWMVDTLGIKFEQNVVSAPEHSVDRIFIGEGKAAGINEQLLKNLAETDIRVILNAQASKLLVEDNKVVGASAVSTTDPKAFEVKADITIIATGGFGNNQNLLPETLQNILYYGPVSSTGDGILIARQIGARTQLMEFGKIYPNGIEIEPGKARSTVTASTAVFNQTGTILVDRSGKRLVNETGPYAGIRTEMMKQEDQSLFLVMDQKAFNIFKQQCIENKYATEAEINSWLAKNGAAVPVFANGTTLEAAAKAAGIDEKGLVDQVAAFNQGVLESKDQFGRKTTLQLSVGPFYIVEQKPRFATTLGGLSINEYMEVMNDEGAAIPGLLAAGEVVGGLHGDDSLPSVCVSWAFTSGRLAGVSAFKHISGDYETAMPEIPAEETVEEPAEETESAA